MDYVLQIIILSVIYGIVAVSCNFILGYGGMATMCHAALWGIGGYTSALIAMHYGANFFICLIASMVISAVFGFVLSCPTLKIRDVYLILFTMAFQIIFTGLVFSQYEITGGDSGLINIPRIHLWGMKFVSPQSHLPLVFILAAIFVSASWHIARSAFGRVLKCIREDEVITQSLGKNVIRFKVLTFTIGSAIAGAAGSIYAHYNAILNPTSFDVNASILLVAMVIIGGAGNVWGSVVGAILLVGMPEGLRFISGTSEMIGPLRTIIYGTLLVLFIRFLPKGILPEKITALAPKKLSALQNGSMNPSANRGSLTDRAPGPDGNEENKIVLELKGVSKAFGGLKAVDSVSLALPANKISGLIGPNGCGKSTLFNLITGMLDADQGEIYLGKEWISRIKPYQRTKMGIARLWQDVRIIQEISVIDNVVVACPNQSGESLIALFFQPRRVAAEEKMNYDRAMNYLAFVGLADQAGKLAKNLSFAEQKMLAIARLLATECPLLLLDEPTSGLDPHSIERILEIIRKLLQEGKTILIIEHNLDVIRALTENVYFMSLGELVAKGTPEQLMANPELAEIYFGV